MSSLCFMIVINPPAMVCTPQSCASLHPSLRPHALQPICRTHLVPNEEPQPAFLPSTLSSYWIILPSFWPCSNSFSTLSLSSPSSFTFPSSLFPPLLLSPLVISPLLLSPHFFLLKLHFFNFASFLFFPPSPTSPAHLLFLLSRSSSVCSCSIAMPLLSTPPTSLLLL